VANVGRNIHCAYISDIKNFSVWNLQIFLKSKLTVRRIIIDRNQCKIRCEINTLVYLWPKLLTSCAKKLTSLLECRRANSPRQKSGGLFRPGTNKLLNNWNRRRWSAGFSRKSEGRICQAVETRKKGRQAHTAARSRLGPHKRSRNMDGTTSLRRSKDFPTSEDFAAVIMKNVVFWDIQLSSYFTGSTLLLRYRVHSVNAM
jgi:hypothetical protein